MKNKLLNLTSIFQRWNHTQTQRWAKACCMFLELFHFSPWRGVQSHLYSTFSSPLLIRLSLSLPPPKTPNPLPLPPEINITPFFVIRWFGHAQHGPHASVAAIFQWNRERERAGEGEEHIEEREEEWSDEKKKKKTKEGVTSGETFFLFFTWSGLKINNK